MDIAKNKAAMSKIYFVVNLVLVPVFVVVCRLYNFMIMKLLLGCSKDIIKPLGLLK